MTITKVLKKEFVQHQLETNPRWALRCLEVVYDNQTYDEKVIGATNHNNKIGFTGTDAEILTSFYTQYKKRGSLSEKQMALLFKKAKKYWKQVLAVSNDAKIVLAMLKAGVVDKNAVEEYEQNLFLKGLE